MSSDKNSSSSDIQNVSDSITEPCHGASSVTDNSSSVVSKFCKLNSVLMAERFGTWNVRSLYRADSLRTVGEEISKYKLDSVGVGGRMGQRWHQTCRRIYIILWKGE
jgi:hypothetical protein